MVDLGVIEKMKEATPVVSPMVVVKQKGKLRICIDLSNLNKNILRRHFPLRTIEEIATRIKNSKRFTKLDCMKGFWQVKVTDRTKKYLTFATPWGRYCCTRLPFGLCSAPEIFQEVMSSLLCGLGNVEVSIDDVLIHDADEVKLNETTNQVLKILSDSGLKLNRSKCIFNKSTMKFLGHILTEKGIKPDDEKIEAIYKLNAPTDKKQLQRLLGMVTYLGKFISNLSKITEPLRRLLHKDIQFVWENDQENAFKEIKGKLTTAPVLKYYDVNKEVLLSVDASSKAFGAVLMQEGHLIAYATKAMTKAQENYRQIEKEAAAIRFTCSKFHQYIYGKKHNKIRS